MAGDKGQKASASAKQQITKAKEAVEAPLTVAWDQIQGWQQDNHYIRSGYRPASGSYSKSAWSLTYIHNETVNIFTHLVGCLFFAAGSYVVFTILKARYSAASRDDVFAMACFFAGAVACLGLSAAYHTMSNHSQAVHKFGNQLDYLGIVCLIWGSFIPSIYYGFTCDPHLVKTYWAMITTVGAGCAIVTMAPKFATPTWRPFRAGMFAAMGLSAVFPVLHGLKAYGLDAMVDLIALPWLVTQGGLYLLGAAIYAARVPEKWKPGRFDIWGSSHQIFHVLVVAAAVVHLVGLIKAFDFHHSPRLYLRCRADYSDTLFPGPMNAY